MASVDNVAITESEVEDEFRLELFLDGKSLVTVPDQLDAATRERLRDRLIVQRLLAEEGSAGSVETADAGQTAQDVLNDIRKRYDNGEAFKTALDALGMNEQQLAARILAQQGILRLIEQRFRPAAWPEASEIETYYRETFLPEFSRESNAPAPGLADVEGKIREILVEKKINQLLDAWITEMKSSRRVKLHEF